MAERLVVDTDVLIDYLRGVSEAVAFLENANEIFLVSTITVAELYAGVREGKERRALEGFLSAFEIVPVDGSVAETGGLFRRDYRQSHGTGLADALIAATAELHSARLATPNARRFPMLPDVIVPYHKPA